MQQDGAYTAEESKMQEDETMKRMIQIGALVTLLLLALPDGVAVGQQTPPAPTARFQTKRELGTLPAPVDLVQLVLDFAPGAFTPPHRHSGQGFVTVVEGEMTRRVQGTEKRFKAGETWAIAPDEDQEVGNATSARARVFATFLVPKGRPLTMVRPPEGAQRIPPGATKIHESTLEVATPPEQSELIHRIVDFAPGAWTPPHFHGGHTLITIVAGELTWRRGGTETSFRAGETVVEHIGEVHTAGNASGAPASIATTILLPMGAQQTTNVPAPAPTALPRTGAGGLATPPVWLALLVVSGFSAGGWLLRRQLTRRP